MTGKVFEIVFQWRLNCSAALLISAILALSLAETISRQNIILNAVSISPSDAANANTRLIDVNRPLSLVMSLDSNGNDNPGQTIRNPNG
jgi:hypothetical protein